MVYGSIVSDFQFSLFLAGKWRHKFKSIFLIYTLTHLMASAEKVTWNKLKTEK